MTRTPVIPYLNELKYTKRNQFPHNSLQTFNTIPKVTLRQALLQYFREYCIKSSVHCIHYLADENLYTYQRLSWGLIFIVATLSTAYVYVELANMFTERRSLTTVHDSLYPTMFVEFPSVALCPPDVYSENKMNLALRHYLPENYTEKAAESFRNFFNAISPIEFDNTTTFSAIFDRYGEWKKDKVNVELINHINITDALYFLSTKCQDILKGRCKWRRHSYDCCQLFKVQRTALGMCLVFNSKMEIFWKEEPLSTLLLYNENPGQGYGLEADVRLHTYCEAALLVLITHPLSFTGEQYHISYNTHSHISLMPEMTEAEKSMRNLGLDQRRCLFTVIYII